MKDRPGKDVVAAEDGLLDPRERALFEEVGRLLERSRQLVERARAIARPKEFLHRFPPRPQPKD